MTYHPGQSQCKKHSAAHSNRNNCNPKPAINTTFMTLITIYFCLHLCRSFPLNSSIWFKICNNKKSYYSRCFDYFYLSRPQAADRLVLFFSGIAGSGGVQENKSSSFVTARKQTGNWTNQQICCMCNMEDELR